MFPEFSSKAALRVLQIIYCEGEFESCARRQLFKSGVIPRKTLLPDGRTIEEVLGTA